MAVHVTESQTLLMNESRTLHLSDNAEMCQSYGTLTSHVTGHKLYLWMSHELCIWVTMPKCASPMGHWLHMWLSPQTLLRVTNSAFEWHCWNVPVLWDIDFTSDWVTNSTYKWVTNSVFEWRCLNVPVLWDLHVTESQTLRKNDSWTPQMCHNV